MTTHHALTIKKEERSFLKDSAFQLSKDFKENPSLMVSYLDRLFPYMESYNPSLNALTSLQKEAALKRAQELISQGPKPHQVLYGVPIVIKENIQKIGFPVQCASAILKGYKGQYDATVVRLLEQAGALLVATANMDEFAMGSSNEYSIHGPVKNPLDLRCVSGGSSGGSAVACRAGFAPLSLGSDTGGSVRQPASFCGIMGFKPTYGRVSRYGLVAYGSSLDQISPFARSVQDLRLIMGVLGQTDPLDGTTLKQNFVEKPPLTSLKGMKIGVLNSLFKESHPEVLESMSKLQIQLKEQGAELIDIDMPQLKVGLSVYYVLASAEASSNLARFDGIRYGYSSREETEGDLFKLYCQSRSKGFGAEVKRRIMVGTFALSSGYFDAYYSKAQRIRAQMTREFKDLFKQVSFLLLPTTPTVAFPLGHQDPLAMYLNDLFTIPANLAGIPALSLPLPSLNPLPTGAQVMAAPGQDSDLLAFAQYLENLGLIQIAPMPLGNE